MTHITRLPENLCYMPTSDLKENGEPVMALDITRTCVRMIPSKLKGVDRVYAKKGQLKYVAPGYKGQIYVIETTLGKNGDEVVSVQSLSTKAIDLLKKSYEDERKLMPDFFSQSRTQDIICSTWAPEEMHLPSKLSFFWNSQKQTGTLNARDTWLTADQPQILNVTKIITPHTHDIQKKVNAENKMRAKEERRSKRRDFGIIRHMTVCGEIIR